jgi:hypothetical protein
MGISPDLELARIAAKARREAARHLKRAVQAEEAAKRAKSALKKERRGAAKVHRFFHGVWLKIAKMGERK